MGNAMEALGKQVQDEMLASVLRDVKIHCAEQGIPHIEDRISFMGHLDELQERIKRVTSFPVSYQPLVYCPTRMRYALGQTFVEFGDILILHKHGMYRRVCVEARSVQINHNATEVIPGEFTIVESNVIKGTLDPEGCTALFIGTKELKV